MIIRFLVEATFRTRQAPEGARIGSREPSKASKTQKAVFAEYLKNLVLFTVLFGSNAVKILAIIVHAESRA